MVDGSVVFFGWFFYGEGECADAVFEAEEWSLLSSFAVDGEGMVDGCLCGESVDDGAEAFIDVKASEQSGIAVV